MFGLDFGQSILADIRCLDRLSDSTNLRDGLNPQAVHLSCVPIVRVPHALFTIAHLSVGAWSVVELKFEVVSYRKIRWKDLDLSILEYDP